MLKIGILARCRKAGGFSFEIWDAGWTCGFLDGLDLRILKRKDEGWRVRETGRTMRDGGGFGIFVYECAGTSIFYS
jgi:hypothetical protein